MESTPEKRFGKNDDRFDEFVSRFVDVQVERRSPVTADRDFRDAKEQSRFSFRIWAFYEIRGTQGRFNRVRILHEVILNNF